MYSDFDLLCVEDAGLILADECTFSEYSLDLDLSPVDMEESIAGFIEDEGDFVHAIFKFQALTAYLAINYLDRFLACRLLPQPNGWPLQLLSVACLSLAAKMEESLVPSLLDIQNGASSSQCPGLATPVCNPFNFLHFFANKVDSKGTTMGFLIAKATEIILMIMKEVNFLGHWPSVVAAAAILCAADEIPNLTPVAPGNAEAWCNGLSKDRVVSCYKLMQEVVVDNCPRTPPKTQFPQLIRSVMAGSNDSDSSSSSSSSWSPLSNKRRKLNNWLTEDDEDKL
ncbi:hypothetical protein Syun_023991 [Stephania yunnanensis]|uniref:Cyclin D1 n=1 Tax=Stephania yunnanensis TaxID=152371 RepID=A0AAP0F9Y8_9MAGN